MALKVKVNKRAITVLAIAGLVIIALVVSRGGDGGDGPGTMDAAATQGCDDFNAGYPKAGSESSRLALADRVSASTMKTGNDAIRNAAAQVGDAANETSAEWKAAGDALLAACRDAGWAR
ncbi:hypothetical protein Ade02nite_02510 [Paractinoplanes deccanensis]|uniref:Uncharacterized protein n=1 Tax=Paractinoplanes deccanensis TaxID=113561 RepID=A0ABQ3XVA1_9ACTN|nr:hypothetical protein [Actinoplanes deccanensis]GID71610.1 hypothetical protein Ade02nite_02510 [Actinoplanes deccanensis]